MNTTRREVNLKSLLQGLTNFAARKLVVALILLVCAAPYAKGSGIYSGVSVGADGTVYGWGVTNVPGTQGYMYHYNYVSGTLTSPNGRTASGSYNATDYARYDVSLPFDPNDTGTYNLQSLSSVYCTAAGAWIVWNALTQAQVTVSVPYSVGVASDVVQGPATCPAGLSGWSRTVYLQLYNQQGQPIQFSLINMADSIQIVQGQNALGLGNPQTGHHVTNNWGQWVDTFYACSPVCPGNPGETDALQWWTANGVPVVQPDLVIFKCGSVTIGGR